ncbi:MAG: DNA polymerase III subunit delta [Candidatus Izimaplasma sp.]|nr:DNA polymerase III subunit delta [Candidatus Izimaplasma bacterium]
MNNNCFLFYGNDSFLIKEQTKKIFIQNNIADGSVEVYDSEEEGIHLALSNALTLPFLVDKKGVVIKDASFLTKQGKITPEEIDDLIRFIDMAVKETILVIQCPYDKLDNQSKIVKFLKKHIITKQYNNQEGLNVYDFVKNKLLENNLKIEPFALTQFVNRIHHDLDSINNEVDKLIAFSYDKETINSDMISEITSKDIDENIFDLVNALLDNNKPKLMEIYHDLKRINTNPIWMLSSITNKFLEMLHTKALLKIGYNQKDLIKYFNTSSGRAYYMKKNAEEVKEELLENYIDALHELDYQIKSGKIDKSLGLELFLLKI